jgi:large subunit ribosomal protein L5
MYKLKEYYLNCIVPTFIVNKRFSNIMEVPKIEKIVINVCFGSLRSSKSIIENVKNSLMLISGQKAVITKARKSISGFKLREGDAIGCKVTLRRQRMYDFLEKLLYIVIPRIKDFNGLSVKSFDGNGNFTLALKECIIFSEIAYENVDRSYGMDITIVTSAKNNIDGLALLESFNFPFKKELYMNNI